MAIPRSIKKIAPSLQVEDEDTATISMADLKALLPSLDIDEKAVRLSLADLRKILRIGLSGVKVDEKWYLEQVPELRRDIPRGVFSSVVDHYLMHGYLEGRLPERPIVDENHYLQTYPDVAAAIKVGKIKSAFEHYVKDGYYEGRVPSPTDQPDRGKKR